MVAFMRSLNCVILLVFLLEYQEVNAQNYCLLCSNHIACNNKGNFGKACSSNRSVVSMTSSRIQLILKAHNEKRNRIALGQVPGYASATKMRAMQWDPELARLAELNAKTCTFGHDKCHKTQKYPSSGQNIALNQSTGSYPDANTSVQEMINLWFSEYKYANMNDIRKFSGTSGIFFLKRKEFGHFTVMVNDKNNATGCAMVRYQKNGFKTNYFVCNYAYTNVVGQQVYESGRAASKCKVRNTVYKGLCK